MKPRISVLTLGVDNLERAVAFYRDGLGLATEGIIGKEFEHGAVAFFDLQSQLKLAVWAQDDLAHDASLPKTARCPTGFTIGHNVSQKSEVDDVMEQGDEPALPLSRRRRTRSTEAMPVISRILTDMSGRSSGIRPSSLQIDRLQIEREAFSRGQLPWARCLRQSCGRVNSPAQRPAERLRARVSSWS
jgi:catechol 2,3-dioxygenase-like lactoylglutathione lyase family enzyme